MKMDKRLSALTPCPPGTRAGLSQIPGRYCLALRDRHDPPILWQMGKSGGWWYNVGESGRGKIYWWNL